MNPAKFSQLTSLGATIGLCCAGQTWSRLGKEHRQVGFTSEFGRVAAVILATSANTHSKLQTKIGFDILYLIARKYYGFETESSKFCSAIENKPILEPIIESQISLVIH